MKPITDRIDPTIKPKLIDFMASPTLPLSPARTRYVEMIDAKTPMARTRTFLASDKTYERFEVEPIVSGAEQLKQLEMPSARQLFAGRIAGIGKNVVGLGKGVMPALERCALLDWLPTKPGRHEARQVREHICGYETPRMEQYYKRLSHDPLATGPRTKP